MPTGEFLVRVRVPNPITGKYKDVARKLPRTATPEDFTETQRSLREASARTVPDAARTRFGDYAQKVMEDRIALGKIVSPETKVKWENTIDNHLAGPWGDAFVDAIKRRDVEEWLVSLGKDMQADKCKLSSVKTWWGVFKTVMSRAAAYFDIKDPTHLVELPSSNHRTYTIEEPNSLLPSEVPKFFEAAWNHEREHFAMLALGMLTGRRACELRPLRRSGKYADLVWETGELRVRRSQTMGEPMEVTKTKKDVVIFLPPTLVDVLRTHVAGLTPSRRDSELLFPPRRSESRDMGHTYMAKSALDKPIKNICVKAEITKRLTAKGAMRRTYQDLCRAAQVNETVQMAMSGHATKGMLELYSSASADEKRSALMRMSDIAGLKEAARL